MSKAGEKGPKKVDKTQYHDMMKDHALQHEDLLRKKVQDHPAADSPPTKESWRKSDQTEETSYFTPQIEHSIPTEEKKLSKHAKRRANKKKKIIVSSSG